MKDSGKKPGWIAAASLHLLLLIGAFWMIMPFYWMVSTSFKSFADSIRIPPVWVPTTFDFSWYADLFRQYAFGTYYWNTLFMTVGRSVPQILFCAMAAYGFSRLRFPGRDALFVMVLAIMMVPYQVILIPQYYQMVLLDWVNSYQGLIVPGMFSAYSAFLLRQFFMTLPKELEEAARIDGCSYWTIFWRILLPLAIPALATTSFFAVLWSWNDFLWPLIVVSDDKLKVLSIGINSLQGMYNTKQPLVMAGAFLATLPLLLTFLILQKFIIRGIAFTGIKA